MSPQVGGFAPALRKHPRHFDDLFCNLVESGEQSGALETLLERIATYKEKTEALKGKNQKSAHLPNSSDRCCGGCYHYFID